MFLVFVQVYLFLVFYIIIEDIKDFCYFSDKFIECRLLSI